MALDQLIPSKAMKKTLAADGKRASDRIKTCRKRRASKEQLRGKANQICRAMTLNVSQNQAEARKRGVIW